ncbi:ABC transporter substrate-binding protein [Candidatus Bipolaricaulota bacterium]|nr:ABC transporter substrate-binding protein [Candidatus Bipolaricaulota bacterium]
MNRRSLCLASMVLVILSFLSLGSELTVVRIALDWTPNTNHTGIYVAKELGFFAEEGLAVKVIEPGPTVAVHLVAAGRSEFGISMQEEITMARAQGIPVVSVAPIWQQNTSGFAAPKEAGIESARDFEHKRYGGWGQDLEQVMLRTAMEMEGADFDTVTMVNIGVTSFTTAIRRNLADFFWIFYGWSGIHARLEGIEFTFLPLIEMAEVFDYYTPLIMVSEKLIETEPELIRRFVRAVRRGYIYSILNPDSAAEILLRFVPELDRELVIASQRWLAEEARDDVDRWGWQESVVWARFADWALENGLIDTAIDPEAAFTTAFLPDKEDPAEW